MKKQKDLKESGESCPICQTDIYLNPNMILLVNLQCYHKMCEACINRLYSSGANACPTCNKTQLRKTDFVKPTFENAQVEKECRIRKRIWKVYNKRLEDFDGDLRAYNDYLEQVEDLIFNLINDIELQETNQKIEEYQKANVKLIQRNMEKRQMEDEMIKQILQDERNDYQMRKAQDDQLVEDEVKEKQRKRQQIIDQLAASSQPAEKILEFMQEEEDQNLLNESKNNIMDIDTIVEAPKRGPSIMQRLEQYKKNMVRIQEADKMPNPFENTLESSYIRNPTPFIMPTYNDPSVRPFDNLKYIAGGFSAKTVYKKALESFYMSICVE